MPEVYFTSDLHLGHRRIIEYSHRPFENIEEMDEMLINNWNSVVQPGDRIYCLGDFALCDVERATQLAKRLNGQKYLIFGNHDKRTRKHQPFVSQWIWARDFEQIEVDGQKITLCHFALRTWNQSHRGAWSLYGHSHGSLKDEPHLLSMDVGVDPNGYFPVSFEQVKAHMAQKTWKPIDHHKNYREEDAE
jgi:calcineurin-like phosphoesterase family protein